MRAIYYPNLKVERDHLFLEGDEAHHLVKVARIKAEEKILLLNGEGVVAEGIVVEVGKKSAQIKLEKTELKKPQHKIHLGLGLPKRDAFEDILRASVELGIQKIYFWKSEYSQHDYKDNDRYQRILESALIQSNNPFLPNLFPLDSENDFFEVLRSYQQAYYFCSHDDMGPQKERGNYSDDETLVIIGPEGGFPPREERLFDDFSIISPIHLSTPILRAPTAVSTAIGYLLAFKREIR